MTQIITEEHLHYIARLEAALNATTGRLTATVAQLASLSLNNVLRSELLVLGDLLGHAHRESAVPYASVGVWAYDSDVTVSAGPLDLVAPTMGIGVIVVPAKRAVVWPLAGTEITLYGATNARVLLTLFSTPQVPSVGGTATGVDGGGA